MPKSIYLPPRRECEAVLVLPAAWRICEAALVLPAALKTPGEVCRHTYRLTKDDARRLSLKLRPRRSGSQSSYLLSRPRCKAAIDPPATFTSRCRSRPTCRLVVDARRLSTYLPACLPSAAQRMKPIYLLPRCGCEAALFLPASWMPKSSYLPPRRGCEAAVAFLRHGGR